MNIEISKETQALVVAAVAEGHFESVEAFLAAVTSEFLNKKARSQGSHSAPNEPSSDAENERKQSWEEFEKPIDLDELARRQGVGPIKDSTSLKFDDWPEDDEVEDFLRRAKGLDAPVEPGA